MVLLLPAGCYRVRRCPRGFVSGTTNVVVASRKLLFRFNDIAWRFLVKPYPCSLGEALRTHKTCRPCLLEPSIRLPSIGNHVHLALRLPPTSQQCRCGLLRSSPAVVCCIVVGASDCLLRLRAGLTYTCTVAVGTRGWCWCTLRITSNRARWPIGLIDFFSSASGRAVVGGVVQVFTTIEGWSDSDPVSH